MTFLPNVLLANASPENVVIRKRKPFLVHLRSAAEGYSVEITKDLKSYFAREHTKGVDTGHVA